MKKLLLVLFVVLATQVQSQPQNYCDSVDIVITNQSLTSVTFSSNTNGFNAFWTSQDWSLTDKYGSVIGTVSGSTATFSMPNPTNFDTNYICLTSILSQPVMTIACNTCDTIIWNGANWVLLSMMMPPPCNLTGGSVYLDYSSNPSVMNATVNGISQYSYVWNNGMNGVNQTQIYPGWCVTITDLATGCDTTICENCIGDPNNVCVCPMIYMPVCGCDGVMYSNSCMAICAGVGWTPAVPNGTLGGFLPCTTPSWDCVNGTCTDPATGNGQYQTLGACLADSCNVVPPPPPPCGVELTGDSIICSLGSPQVLIASPNSSTLLPVTYSWSNGQSNSHILTITNPGTYCVTVTDANGCTSTECITVLVQDIPIYSAPSPPIICLGDSIVLEIDTIGISNIIWVPNTLITPPLHRIVDFPVFSHQYVVEAFDYAGCDRRGEIFVTVDSCSENSSWDCDPSTGCYEPGTGLGVYPTEAACVVACQNTALNEEITDLLIYPNPAGNTLTIVGNYTSATIYDIFGKMVLTAYLKKTIDVETLSNGIYFIHISTDNVTSVKNIIIDK